MKVFVAGLWAVIVALGATYAAALVSLPPKVEAQAEKAQLQVAKTRVLNVPIIADGAVKGYIVAQFNYTTDPTKAKGLSVSPEVFLLDEAFRAIYTDDKLDFLHLAKYDVNALTAHLIAATNKRLGADIVHDILIQDFTFISKEDSVR